MNKFLLILGACVGLATAAGAVETATAYWNVSFDPNGGVATWNEGQYIEKFSVNNHYVVGQEWGALPSVERPGHTVRMVNGKCWYAQGLGWVSESDVVKNMAQYAQLKVDWIVNTNSVYFVNGGDIDPVDLPYDEDLTLPEPTARAGYTFTGWLCSTDEATYPAGEVVSGLIDDPRASITMTAQWRVHHYTIAFDANAADATGAMVELSDVAYDVSTALTANAFVRKGYTFAGWSTNATETVDFSNGANVRGLTAVDGGRVTLYAVWQRNRYLVEFNGNDADNPRAMTSQTFFWNETSALTSNLFQKAGSSFLGWSESKTAKLATWADGANFTYDIDGESLTLYAVWAEQTFRVIFHAEDEGVSGTTAPQAFTYSTREGLTPNAFTRPGYDFLGWSRTPGASTWVYYDGQPVDGQTLYSDGQDVHLYAVWGGAKFTVTFKNEFGTPQSVVVTNGVAYGAAFPAVPTHAGYAFAGWWWMPEEGGRVQIAATDIAAMNRTNFVARWKAVPVAEETITVTFDANGGAAVEAGSYTVDDLYGELPTPARDGYRFMGWYTTADLSTGTRVMVNDRVTTGDKTLYAIWSVAAFNDALGESALAFTTGGSAAWTVEDPANTVFAEDVTQGLRSGEIDLGGESWLETTLVGPGKLNFKWNVSCDDMGANLSFRIYSSRAEIDQPGGGLRTVINGIENAWKAQTCELGEGETKIVRWYYSRDKSTAAAGQNRGWLSSITWTTGSDGDEALAAWDAVKPGMAFTTVGVSPWMVQDADFAEGSNAVQSGAELPDNRDTRVETKVDGTGILTFDWKTSCEEGYVDTNGVAVLCDYAEFLVDGRRVATLDGISPDWQSFTYTNALAGSHVYAWRYVKDGGETYGDDWARLDAVAWEARDITAGAAVTGSTNTYDAVAHGITVTPDAFYAGATVRYATDREGPYGPAAITRTDVGTTTVWCEIAKDGYPTITNSADVVIEAKSIAGAAVTLMEAANAYCGAPITQLVAAVTIDGLEATYTVSGDVGTAVGDYTLTVTGTGNFTGSTNQLWTIVPGTIDLTLTGYAGVYDGTAHGVGVMSTPAEATFSYSRNGETFSSEMPVFTDVGTTSVWVAASAENYHSTTGRAEITILPKPLVATMAAEIPAQPYTGEAIEPAVTLADEAPAVLTDDDWFVTGYRDNVEPGTAYVTVEGCGNYVGSFDVPFTIMSKTETALRQTFAAAGTVEAVENGWSIVLTNDVTQTVELADNLGDVVLDLNGHDIAGSDGTEIEGDGEPAIRIVCGEESGEPTLLVLTNGDEADAAVIGGEGAAGVFVEARASARGVGLAIDEGVAVGGTPGIYGHVVENLGTVEGGIEGDIFLETGDYFKKTLSELGFDVPTNGTVYSVTAKGLPSGLALKYNAAVKNKKGKVVTKAKTNWWIEGVPTAAIDSATLPVYLTITVGGKSTTVPFSLDVLAQDVVDLGEIPVSVKMNEQYWLPGVTSGWSVTGLPTGLKYTAKLVATKTTKTVKKKKVTTVTTNALPYSVYGTPSKAGLYTITAKKKVASYYETLKFRVLVTPKAVDTALFSEGLTNLTTMAYVPVTWYLTNDVAAIGGKVAKVAGLPTGLSFAAANVYAYKNTKKKTGKYLKREGQTILGTPTKPGTYVVTFTKNVKSGKKTVAKTAQILWKVVPNDTVLEMDFNTAGGVIETGSVGLKYTDLLAFTATSNATVTASGLPKGITLKKLEDGRYALTGYTVKAGTYFVTVKATLKGHTVTQRLSLKVDGLPAWAKGSYRGFVRSVDGSTTNGLVTVTVSSVGKLSGKFADQGTNWTFSAASYTGYDAEDTNYSVTVSAAYTWSEKVKKGKKTTTVKHTIKRPFTLMVAPGIWSGTLLAEEVVEGGEAVGACFEAWQNLWGSTYKTLGKALFYKSSKVKYRVYAADALGTKDLSLKITTAGAVTATLTYDTGKTKKNKKTKKLEPVLYKPTCSTLLVPTCPGSALKDDFTGEIVVFFAPSAANNFAGYAAVLAFPL